MSEFKNKAIDLLNIKDLGELEMFPINENYKIKSNRYYLIKANYSKIGFVRNILHAEIIVSVIKKYLIDVKDICIEVYTEIEYLWDNNYQIKEMFEKIEDFGLCINNNVENFLPFEKWVWEKHLYSNDREQYKTYSEWEKRSKDLEDIRSLYVNKINNVKVIIDKIKINRGE